MAGVAAAVSTAATESGIPVLAMSPREPSGAEAGDILTLLDEVPGPTEETPPAPSAPERDTFIPPAPVHPDEVLANADPFAEAAIENGAGEGGKRKKPTLFERVAEAAGVVSGERRAQAAARIEPVAPPAAGARPRQTASAAGDGGQPRLGGLEPGHGTGATDAEGEMLDIPAFLRRQAN